MTRGPLLVLAPHSDDAALSVGGLLLRTPLRVVVHTVFGRSNYTTDGFHDEWRRVTAVRRAEDAAYCESVDAALRYGSLPEAAIRIGPSMRQVFARPGARVPSCSMLDAALARTVARVRPRAILAPAALGRHVDHLVVRRAARRLTRASRTPIAYYEDLPYAARIGRRRLENEILSFDTGLRPIAIQIDRQLTRKLRGLRLYTSQLGEEEAHDVRRHARRWGRSAVERLWSRWTREALLGEDD